MDPSREREVEQAPVVNEPEPTAAEAPSLAGPLTAARIAALQRHAGNAAVARLLNGRPPATGPRRPVAPRAGSLARFDAAGFVPSGGAAGAGAGAAELLGGASGGAAAGATAGELFGGAAGGAAGPVNGGAAAPRPERLRRRCSTVPLAVRRAVPRAQWAR